MQIKLADYGKKKEKFERFLELGDFAYLGDRILVEIIYNGRLGCNPTDIVGDLFEKDEKDPLNRFLDSEGKGLFDGKTYGGGRFVLVKDNDYAITKHLTKIINNMEITGDFVIGNLIENPELWEKVR